MATTPITSITALDIIKTALKVIGAKGIGDSLSADEADECLMILNMMIDEWNIQPLLQYYKMNELFDLVAGQIEYTIGDGGDFDTTRPIQVLSAFNRENNGGAFPIDRAMNIIDNDTYQQIVSKNYGESYPDFLLYTPEYPIGKITIAGTPIANLQLGLSQVKQLNSGLELTTTLALPPGYLMMIRYNLGLHLAPIYGKVFGPGSTVYEMANRMSGNVKIINSDSPLSDVQVGSRRGSRRYSIYEG